MMGVAFQAQIEAFHATCFQRCEARNEPVNREDWICRAAYALIEEMYSDVPNPTIL